MKKKWRGLAFVVVFSLLAGVMPIGKTQTAQSNEEGYGLHNPVVDENGTVTWDCISFGNYWQEDTNGDRSATKGDDKQPIKWRVLSVDGDDAFLLADKNLYGMKYQDMGAGQITWEECELRAFLNGEFLEDAFSEEEQAAIKTTTVVNEDNFEYGTEGGNDTQDKVYLLSLSEVMNPAYGFPDEIRQSDILLAVNSGYARQTGMVFYPLVDITYYGEWWLRSPGYSTNFAAVVDAYGWLDTMGSPVISKHVVVRPVLHLDLSSDVWSPADSVIAEEAKPTEQPTIAPTGTPTVAPTGTPTATPTGTPTATPTATPAISPTGTPAATPTVTPTTKPTENPVVKSTVQPAASPKLTSEPDASSKQKGMPGKVANLKGKAKKKAIALNWKKVSNAQGYEVWYSTSKTFKKKSVKTTKAVKFTVKKLKGKKKYYVKVRAYNKRNGKKVYGKWSKTVKIKTK